MTGDRPIPTNPELEIDFPDHQRRWTVLPRLILAVPHLVVLIVLSVAMFVTVVIGWFAALVLGRLPGWAHRFLADYLRWYARLGGYLLLLTDRYPQFDFASRDYPVRLVLDEQRPLNRAAVLFRIILLIPVSIVSTLLYNGVWLLSVVTWVSELVVGRIPVVLFEANAAFLRFDVRLQAYSCMVTSAYPKKLFGDGPAVGSQPATRPLLLSKAAKWCIIGVLVLGFFPNITEDIERPLNRGIGQHTQCIHAVLCFDWGSVGVSAGG